MRFLLIREDLFQQEVLPSGLFPVQEVEALKRVRHDLPLKKGEVLSLVHNPTLHQTPRPEVLRTLFVGEPLHELKFKYVSYEVTESKEERPICFFKVDKVVLLRRISSKCFLDEKGGTLHVEESGGFRVSGEWKNCCCSFDKPLPLRPKLNYRFEYMANAGRVAQEMCNSFEHTVESVTFKGMQFCSNFSLEFVKFPACDFDAIDKLFPAMKPRDHEQVMRHQLDAVERLIAVREAEQKERLLLKAQQGKPGDKAADRDSQELQPVSSNSDEEFEDIAELFLKVSNEADTSGASGTGASNAAEGAGPRRADQRGAPGDRSSVSLQVNNATVTLEEQLEEAMEDAFP